ncbi:MAG: potassium channel family protein [Firmicutes bacterium]|nr:potassium channel family protein [Bacillota bacterium]
MHREIKNIVYEVFFSALALVAVILAFVDMMGKIPVYYHTLYIWADRIILATFLVDYIYNLVKSKSKKQYIKEHIFDLLALIPFDSLFRAFRLFRIFRLLVFFKRFSERATIFLHINGFIYILYFTIICIFTGAILIYFAENGKTIHTFGDAVWWSFVTTTTVGYGDISPVTVYGRIIAAVLMIVGIGFISMLTGTIATFFLGKVNSSTEEELSPEELRELENYKQYLLSKREK